MFYELIILLIAFFVILIIIYPTIWVFIASFKTDETLFSSDYAEYTLNNYYELFESGFGLYIFNSFYICLISVLITIFVSVNAAYVFSRKDFVSKRLFLDLLC